MGGNDALVTHLPSSPILFPLLAAGRRPAITATARTMAGVRTAMLSTLFFIASGQTDVPGRYAHCAISFGDHMIVYGGRGSNC